MRRAAILTVLALMWTPLGWTALGCAAPERAWLGRSPDGSHRAELRATAGGQRLLVDGRALGGFEAVATEHLAWAGGEPVVPVRTGRGWHLLHGSRLGPAHDAIGAVRVDGDDVAYAALGARGWRMFHGGEPGPWHDTILASSIALERGRLVYAARDDDGARVVDRGRRGPPFRHVDRVGYAGKAERLVYVAYDDESARIVEEGRAGRPLEAVHELARAAASPQWAAIVDRDGARWLIRDHEATPLPDAARGLALSDDGAHAAWVTEDAREVVVWLDGERQGAHAEVGPLAFVPVSGALLYVATGEDGARVVHAGVAGPRFDRVEPPVTSARGLWGYIGRRRAGAAVVVNGAPVFRGEWAGSLTLAGQAWAVVTRHAGARHVLTAAGPVEVSEPFVDTLVLSPDGAHWAISTADPGRRRVRVIVDGADAAELSMDELSSELLRHADGSRAARAVVARELARVTALPTGDLTDP